MFDRYNTIDIVDIRNFTNLIDEHLKSIRQTISQAVNIEPNKKRELVTP